MKRGHGEVVAEIIRQRAERQVNGMLPKIVRLGPDEWSAAFRFFPPPEIVGLTAQASNIDGVLVL